MSEGYGIEGLFSRLAQGLQQAGEDATRADFDDACRRYLGRLTEGDLHSRATLVALKLDPDALANFVMVLEIHQALRAMRTPEPLAPSGVSCAF